MRTVIVPLLLVAIAGPAAAHHSAARFDLTQSVAVEGVVSRYEWANPHVYIFVTEMSAAGEAVDWEIEGQPPAMMRRIGWSNETLAVGDAVRVTGRPARNASKSLLLTTLQRAEATLYDARNFRAALAANAAGGAPAASSAAGLDGVWLALLNFEVTAGFASPGRWPLTEAGASQLETFDEATMNPAADCVPLPAPTIMVVPDVRRITVQEGSIHIAGEFDSGERVIHVGHGAAIPKPSIQGHSVGRWDGKTLIVETRGFAPHVYGNGMGLKSSPAKRLVERFTIDDDGTGLAYAFELTDPEVLAAPVTGQFRWVYRPDVMFTQEPCDKENARRFLN